MKFNITQKLLVVVTLPIITLLIFSTNHIRDRYDALNSIKEELLHIDIMQNSGDLIHQLQIERGLSSSYLYNKRDNFFLIELDLHRKKTDIYIDKFNNSIKLLAEENTTFIMKDFIKEVQQTLNKIYDIRLAIKLNNIEPENSFDYYTLLNNQLISVVTNFKLYSETLQTNTDISALYKIISLQEYAGQERALISKILTKKDINSLDRRLLYKLDSAQYDEYKNINFLLDETKFSNKLKKIKSYYNKNLYGEIKNYILKFDKKKYILDDIYRTIGYGGIVHNYNRYQKNRDEKLFTEILEKKLKFETLISQYILLLDKKSTLYNTAKKLQVSFNNISKNSNVKLDNIQIFNLYKQLFSSKIDLDPKTWFNISTLRIDEIHEIEQRLFANISESLKLNIEKHKDSLKYQIILTFLTIFLLLVGTYYISRNIKHSIFQLENGLNDFFNFLNFKNDKPNNIITNSNDEINKMVQIINYQMTKLENNLIDDKNFIHEITEIVKHMHEGDFSKRPHFIPNNPSLVELKSVFDELLQLIQNKIKEQTDSLESLNKSLNNRVNSQTLELEQQIQEITISRDKAIKAEVAKDEFLANMSHEIRTPLNAILGFVTILKKQVKDEKILKYLNIIDTSSKSLLTIINDILDFSKIQSGKFTITPYEINPSKEMNDVTLLFSSKAYEKNLVYSVYIDPNLPRLIKVDAVRVKQIFSNLLSNAIKFTQKNGKITVTISCIESNLNISIEDTGIGIAKENIRKIFTAFEQADGSTTRKYGGTGLGLSISYKLAKLMHGDLNVSSELEKGSKFTLSVPIDIIDNNPNKKLDSQKVNLNKDTNNSEIQLKGNILIAEDNKTNQMLISLILEEYGLNYKIAKNGEEAVEAIKHESFDLVLMDENMPKLNGIGAMKKIREYQHENSITPTPIIALTANALDVDEEMFLNVGMDGYLSKPINNTKLEIQLSKFLKNT